MLERLCDSLNLRLLPRIPEEGSVGASGDLTPLSYLAAALLGEREVSLRGELISAADGLARAGLEPLALQRAGEPRDHERNQRDGGARLRRLHARPAAGALGVGAHRDRLRHDAREPRRTSTRGSSR